MYACHTFLFFFLILLMSNQYLSRKNTIYIHGFQKKYTIKKVSYYDFIRDNQFYAILFLNFVFLASVFYSYVLFFIIYLVYFRFALA